MPYNPGTGIYTLPAVYLAVPGTTILATQHNTPLEDLEVANNYARPIVAGGTGQNSAVLARGSTGLATEGNIGSKGSNIASAAALTLVDNFNYFHVTGVVTVTSITTRPQGQRILLEFEAALLLTHNATSLILPGGVNITTAAGDVAEFVSEGSGNWRMANYSRAAGFGPTIQIKSTPGAFTYTPTAGAKFVEFEMVGGGGGGGNVDGQGTGTGGAGGGGASGFYGKTARISLAGVVSASGSIGSGGSAALGGTNTTITVGATTYTCTGGGGGGSMVAGGTPGGSQDGGAPGTGTNVVGFSQPGGIGVYSGGNPNTTGGNGGSSPFGSGGKGQHRTTAGAVGGLPGAGFGAGGSGAGTCETVGDGTGGAGSDGYLRATEYY